MEFFIDDQVVASLSETELAHLRHVHKSVSDWFAGAIRNQVANDLRRAKSIFDADGQRLLRELEVTEAPLDEGEFVQLVLSQDNYTPLHE